MTIIWEGWDNQKQKTIEDISDVKLNISDLLKKIENIDAKKWSELKEKKMELYKKCELLNSHAKYSDFSDFIEFWNKSTDIDDIVEKIEIPNNLKSVYELLQLAKNTCIIFITQFLLFSLCVTYLRLV